LLFKQLRVPGYAACCALLKKVLMLGYSKRDALRRAIRLRVLFCTVFIIQAAEQARNSV